jgi:hypothetical protein
VVSLCACFGEQTDGTAGHKPRIHPKEASHRIEDLPSLLRVPSESEKMSAAELVESLGLQATGAGKNVELWYVGSGEPQDDVDLSLNEKKSVDLPIMEEEKSK